MNKKICIFLILIFCIIGAASAAEDVSMDVVDASSDAVVVDAVSEDVSDSVESIDDEVELAVVESASAQEENDDVELGASVVEEPALDESVEEDSGQSPKSILTTSVLKDSDAPNEIYVNESKEDSGDGSSWSEAYGEDMFYDAMADIADNGIIYLAPATYGDNVGRSKNITVIGIDRENTIINVVRVGSDIDYSGVHYLTTVNNVTFNNKRGKDLEINNDVLFINCTFFNHIITSSDVYSTDLGTNGQNTVDIVDSYAINFVDCEFKDFNIVGSLIEVCKFSQITFNNCTFDNIAANSIVNNTGGFTLQDSVNFKECTFNNVNVKGIVDVPTGTILAERVHIEDCVGVESFGTVTEDGRDFVNTTQSRIETVLVTDIDSEGNLLINLADANGNALGEYEVLISVNGGEAAPYALGSDGTLSIALTDLTDATGKLNIAVSFEEDDDYKGSSDSISTVLVVNTVTEVINNTIVEYVNKTLESTNIVASALTATAKVAKTLSVTLKDASGKAIANKVITYSINGVTKTAKTDANGIAKITVNQAKAGTYYYDLCFHTDDNYKASFKSVKVTVNKQATKAVFKAKTFKVKAKTKKLSFTLKDAKGKAIKGKKITVKVNGKTYTAKTNAKGVATVSLKLTKKGKYTATAKFAGDTSYKAITKKAKITLK